MALGGAADRVPVTEEAVRAGLVRASLPGRLQLRAGSVERILDVAHNPQAAEVLAVWRR